MDNNTLVNVYFCQVIDEVNINTKMFFFCYQNIKYAKLLVMEKEQNRKKVQNHTMKF